MKQKPPITELTATVETEIVEISTALSFQPIASWLGNIT